MDGRLKRKAREVQMMREKTKKIVNRSWKTNRLKISTKFYNFFKIMHKNFEGISND